MTVCTGIVLQSFGALHNVYCVLQTFRHSLSVPSWRVRQSKKNTFWAGWPLKVGPIGWTLSKWLPVYTAHYPRSAKRKPVVTHVKECLVHVNKKTSNILISLTFRRWYIDDSELIAINRVWVLVDKFHQYQRPDVLTSAHTWSTTTR